MFARCPECNLTFRVTAGVLKQAAGKVRCGACSHTFNAIDYLIEDPTGKANGKVSRGSPPELAAEPGDEPVANPPPAAVTPEQNRELLETLERLADSDVRIEDTGVEWRILGDGEGPENDASEAESGDASESGNRGRARDDDAESPDNDGEELRFDDDTGLPDDFDYDAPAKPPSSQAEPEPEKSHTDTHVDIAFGDPEEWSALLGEVARDVPADETDDDESSGIAVSNDDDFGVEAIEIGADAAGDDDAGNDLERDLEEMDALLDSVEPEATGDIEFELAQAHRDLDDSSIDEDLMAAAFETERRDTARTGDDDSDAPEPVLEPGDDDGPDIGVMAQMRGSADESLALDLDALDDDDDSGLDFDSEAANEAAEGDAEASVIDALDELEELDEPVEFIDEDVPAAEIPEPTEEERTINRMIDRELLAAGCEDGFASTIIMDEDIAKKALEPPAEAPDQREADVAAGMADPSTEPDAPGDRHVETIVMEGESVRDGAEEQALTEAQSRGGKDDTDAEIDALRKKLRADAEAEAAASTGLFEGKRLVASVVLLSLLLVIQGIHFSRSALATMPGLGDAIEPVYRAIGMPITPNWDITGWEFEKTTGGTDPTRFMRTGIVEPAEDATRASEPEVLTIYSRIGNRSDQPLPYPLISVSLTDRFEETIGNEVLEPQAYLARSVEPGARLAAGTTFDAIISIAAPSADATGFRLNVCYRLASGRLSCAIQHFK